MMGVIASKAIEMYGFAGHFRQKFAGEADGRH
jgi:hypothetical protein